MRLSSGFNEYQTGLDSIRSGSVGEYNFDSRMMNSFLLLGKSGTGKSGFVNSVLNLDQERGSRVGKWGSLGVTNEIKAFSDKKLTLVDVPGFDGPSGDPFQIVRNISKYCERRAVNGAIIVIRATSHGSVDKNTEFIFKVLRNFAKFSTSPKTNHLTNINWSSIYLVLTNSSKLDKSFNISNFLDTFNILFKSQISSTNTILSYTDPKSYPKKIQTPYRRLLASSHGRLCFLMNEAKLVKWAKSILNASDNSGGKLIDLVGKNEVRIEGHNNGVRSLGEIKGKGDWVVQEWGAEALRGEVRREVEVERSEGGGGKVGLGARRGAMSGSLKIRFWLAAEIPVLV
jgi:GTP-binding protein EngB required for normal cell division